MTGSSNTAQQTPDTTYGDVQVQSSPGVDSTPDSPAVSVKDPFSGVDSRGGLDRTAATGSSRRRKTRARLPVHVWVTGGLILLIVELVALGLLGPMWWAIANAALLAAVIILALAWRRKGKGGLLATLATAWARRPRALGGRGRAGGHPGSGAPGVRSGRSPLAGLRSKLPRFLGGTAAGRGRTPGASGAGAPGGGKRGLLNRLRHPRGGAPAGGGKQHRSPLAGLLGRTKKQGAPGRSHGGSATGRDSSPRSRNRNGNGPAGGGKKTPWWRRHPRKGTSTHATNDHGLDKADKPAGDKPAGDKPAGDKGSAKPTPPTSTTPAAPTAPPAPTAGPRHAGRPGTGGTTMTDPNGGSVAYSDDQSLQAWGRNLGGAEAAAAEVAAKYREAEAAASRFNGTFGKIRNQGETELPTSNTLMSDVQTIHARSSAATDSQTWDSISSECGTLPSQYRRQHETDEDRINAPRKSLNAEMRADARHASTDR